MGRRTECNARSDLAKLWRLLVHFQLDVCALFLILLHGESGRETSDT